MTISTPAELTPLQKAFMAIRKLQGKIDGLEQAAQEPIAIVGLGCRLPGADSPAAFWDLLRNGSDLITEIPADRFDLSGVYDPEPGRPGKTYSRHGSFLSGIDRFDASFFGITAREAEAMDPQQRVTLEVAWEALEDAGMIPAQMAGSRTGVFVGVTSLDYGLLQLDQVDRSQGNPYFNTGTPLNACAGRVSYVLGLQGPCMAVDTACSSSLTAIHLACTSLRAGDCDAALAGGVNVILVPQLFVTLSAAGMLSPDGRCKTFDASANGYVRGEGCGLVVLKRLSDARRAGDTILALIRATAVNQDGASSGFTVPNGPAQQKLIQATLAKAAIAPEDIDYVEAHGTGTSIGDLIETQTLGAVLGQARAPGDPLLVGSVKSNIGHLESAAGVAGLIKLVQALRHELLPASLHVARPNPAVAWESLNVRPVLSPTAWPRRDRPRRAGLSSFGASGSNAHLIVEEAPAVPASSAPDNHDRPVHVLTLTAKSEAALRDLAGRYATWLATTPPVELANACFSANTGRSRFKHRAAIVATDTRQAVERLTALHQGTKAMTASGAAKPPRCAFLFSGQGGLHAGAGRALYDGHDGFRQAMQSCETVLAPLLDRPLLSALYSDDADGLLGQPIYAQPALFALQYALAGLWRSWGLEPHAVMGHSLGEYAAACHAGMVGLEDGLRLVLARARLMQELPEWGGMVAVIGAPALVEQAVMAQGADLSIAAFNGPQETVVAGTKAALAPLVERLERAGLATKPLRVTHGFHSPVMDPILDDLARIASGVAFQPSRLAFVSNLTGDLLAEGTVLDGTYWQRQCREPVRFAQGLNRLLDDGIDLFIEMGAHPVLAQFGRRRAPGATWLCSLARQRDCWSQLADSVAEAFIAGAEVDWSGFDQGFARTRVTVPTYAFQRKSYWFAAKETTMDSVSTSSVPARDSRQVQHQAVFDQVRILVAGMLRITPEEVNTAASFLELGADSLVLVEGIRLIQDKFGVKLEIRQFFEDLPTISALADYLADRTTFGLPATTATPTPNATLAAPAPVQPAVAPVAPTLPLITHPIAAQTSAPVAAPITGSALEHLVLAQMQLMSQQLALLQGGMIGQPTAMPVTPLPQAITPPLPPVVTAPAVAVAPTFAAKVAAAPVKEDRSSPLRALSNPITPDNTNRSPRQEQHLAALFARYQQRTPKSKELAQACRAGLADSRASVGFRFSTKDVLYPITGVESSGSRMRDVDGNSYIDLTMGFGVLLFGSRPDFMKGVLEDEIARGFQLGPRSDLMLEVTQLFTGLTGHERVAFTNSGTEAIMIALRLARAATGRTRIAMFEGSYHGHSDGTLAKSVRDADGTIRSEPVAPGIPESVANDVLVLEYGTAESLEILRRHAHELAAVLVEPVQSRRLDLQPVEFLRQVRALTEQAGTALIFDEMITGFRAHPAGVQGLFGIKADIAAYGKIIGGGMPIGAVAGTGRFLDGIDGGFWTYGDKSYPKATRTYFGGTFCQHPFAMAACRAALRHLTDQGPGLQERLNQRTADLARTLNDWFLEEGLSLRVSNFASAFRLEFSGNLEVIYYHLLEKGIYIWEWRNCFLSTAHTDEDIAAFIKAVKDSVTELRQGGFLPDRPPPPVAPPPALAEATGAPAGFWSRQKSKLSHRDSVTATAPLHDTGDRADRGMVFGLSYFGPYDAAFTGDKYALLLESARYADQAGFHALWVPERHFHEFGGLSPNPSILTAALARETSRIALRAGSVVMPLHDPIRVAEEWSVVDNLSGGRTGVAFASGWHAHDFVFAPDAYPQRRELTFDGMEQVRRLWRGEKIARRAGGDAVVDVGIYPLPQQAELPSWLTIVNNPDTYRQAGETGVGVLTNLMGQSLDDLARNIAIYRQALADHGHDPAQGNVTVLIHTYIRDDAAEAVATARQPMCDYLLSSIGLFQRMAQSEGKTVDMDRLTEEDKAYLVQTAYEKYVATSALIGSPDSCAPIIQRLMQIGVDELACFVDFGVERTAVLEAMPCLAQLRDRFLPHANAAVPMREGGDIRPFALSEAQRQLWILSRLSADGSRAYNDPAALRLSGPLNLSALQQALALVIARHEGLRTRIDADGLHQMVHPPGPLTLPVTDLSVGDDPEGALAAQLAAHSTHLFDLSHDSLFQPVLYRLAPDHHVLVLLAHHIASDGPSIGVVVEEMLACYDAACRGGVATLPLPAPYRDFVRWHDQHRDSAEMAAHEAYWLGQFSRPISALELPTDRPRPAVKTYVGGRAWLDIGPPLFDALRKLGSAHGCTPYMVLLATYAALLHRLSGQDEVVIGCPYVGRAPAEGKPLVGYCVHMLPVLSRTASDTTFAEHLRAIRAQLLDAFQHQDYPFARLIDRLDLKRDPSRALLVNAVFNLERLAGSGNVAGLQVESQAMPVAFAKVDLTLTVFLQAGKATVECDYNTDLFDLETIKRMLDQYRVLLEAAIADADQNLKHMPLLGQDAFMRQIGDWNRVAPGAMPGSFHKAFEAQVLAHPDRVALIDEGTADVSLTYRQLNRCANQLAHRLVQMGVGTDHRVGLCLSRSWRLLVAMLATLKAGGAFVPLDPAYPAARLAMMQADAKTTLLLTESEIHARLPELGGPALCLDSDWSDIAQEPTTNPTLPPLPATLAYVIYTSGSTGRPKGVMINHQGFLNYLRWAVDAYTRDGGDGAPVLGSIGFDATLTSLFVPLLAGRKVTLLTEGGELDALSSLRRRARNFDFVKITPAHLEVLNTMVGTQLPQDMAKFLVLGGEALSAGAINPWLHSGQVRAVNEYGPTETVVGCCVHTASEPLDGIVPIGRPIAGTRLYVLDRNLQVAPPGVPGELFIGGAGLARGYLDRPDLTATAFIPDPFVQTVGATPGDRLYRTGDRARYLADGTLVFLGRLDRQIKLNGFRIELGEIEVVLARQPGVQEAVVLLREDQPGHPRLAAYIRWEKAATDGEDGIEALRRGLHAVLPHYMVPPVIVPLAEFPLTTNGKIDRTRLPVPDPVTARAADNYVPPRSEVEREMVSIWRDVLGVETVGINDNFFDLGGNSLLLLKAGARMEHLISRDDVVIEFFRYPTIAALAQFISGGAAPAVAADAGQVHERTNRQRAAARQQAARRLQTRS